MAGKNTSIKVNILGDASGLKRAFGDAGNEAKTFGQKSQNAFKSLAKGALFIGAAAGGVAILGKGLYDQAIESQKIAKQTEAVIKSTGGTANITAGQVDKLASSLSMKAGVDDELIASGENMLLTFTNIRNEAGKGNDVFNQATQAALDYSVATGTDLVGANKMLGKALNDPIKGLAQLGKAGVSFTQSQKDQIKNMVEAGDTMGAQKIILAEFNKEFGGSAAAQATSGDRLKVIWENLQEQLGAKLIPMLEKVADWLSKNLPKAMETATKWAKKLGDKIKALGNFFNKHKELLIVVAGAIVGVLVGAFYAWAAAAWAASSATLGALAPFIAIGAAVGLLAAGLKWAYDHVGWFHDAVDAVVKFIKDNAGPAFRKLLDVIKTVFNWVKDNWKLIGTILFAPIVLAVKLITAHWDKIKVGIRAVVAVIKVVWSVIKKVLVDPVVAGVKTIIANWDKISAAVRAVFGAIKSTWANIWGFLDGAASRLGGYASTFFNAAKSVGAAVWNGIKSGLNAATGFVGDIASGVTRAIKSAINTLIGGLNSALPNKLGAGIFSIDLPDNPIPKMHSGGLVTGPAGSEQLRMLQAGEYVMSRSQVANGMGTSNIIINLNGTNVTPESVVKALSEYERRNGRKVNLRR